MYIYMHIQSYIYIYTCIYIYKIQIYRYVYIYIYIYRFCCIYIYVYIYIYTHLCNDKQCKPGAFGHEFCFVLQYLWRIDGRLSLGQDFMSTTYLWLSFYSFYNKTWRRASTWRHTAALPLVPLRFKQHQSPIIAETRSPPGKQQMYTNMLLQFHCSSSMCTCMHMFGPYPHVLLRRKQWSVRIFLFRTRSASNM